MSGIFSRWQPRYAEHGIATFPVTAEKTPATKGYLRTGIRGSSELARKFRDANAFGFACGPHNKVTLADIDTKSERALSDALSTYGNTPIITRTASGGFRVAGIVHLYLLTPSSLLPCPRAFLKIRARFFAKARPRWGGGTGRSENRDGKQTEKDRLLRCSIGTSAKQTEKDRLLFHRNKRRPPFVYLRTQKQEKERAHAGHENIGCTGIRWRNGHWNASAESGSRCVHRTGWRWDRYWATGRP